MGRIYSIPIAFTALTAAADIAEVLAAAEKPFRIHEIKLMQSSDAGDSESEQLRFSLWRVTGAPTSGSGGNTVTPVPLTPNDTAAGVTAETHNTTALSGGTATLIAPMAENIHVGVHYLPTPELRPVFAGGTRALVTLDAAPADSVTIGGWLMIEELV